MSGFVSQDTPDADCPLYKFSLGVDVVSAAHTAAIPLHRHLGKTVKSAVNANLPLDFDLVRLLHYSTSMHADDYADDCDCTVWTYNTLFQSPPPASLEDAFSLQGNPGLRALVELADGPIRNLSWMTQVMVGMWRRNGNAQRYMVFNYRRSPLNKCFLQNDMVALQTAGLGLGPFVILHMLLVRFELLPWMGADPRTRASNNREMSYSDDATAHTAYAQSMYEPVRSTSLGTSPTGVPAHTEEHSLTLAFELLGLIIQYIVYQPPVLDGPHFRTALEAAVVHTVLGGARHMSPIQVVQEYFPDDRNSGHCSEDMLYETVSAVCRRRAGAGPDSPDVFDVKDNCLDLYDPEYPCVSDGGAMLKANEEVQLIRKRMQDARVQKAKKEGRHR
jgi:hypothetical protein